MLLIIYSNHQTLVKILSFTIQNKKKRETYKNKNIS
nr:MAG TPA: hypothetical protein [Caudoviricetes sp.]